MSHQYRFWTNCYGLSSASVGFDSLSAGPNNLSWLSWIGESLSALCESLCGWVYLPCVQSVHVVRFQCLSVAYEYAPVPMPSTVPPIPESFPESLLIRPVLHILL